MKSLVQPLNHFAFFRNKEIDALYLTLALMQFVGGLAGIFVPIYLWNLGEPLWKILSFFFLKSFFFICIAVLLIPFIKKLSDKLLMLLSIPFLALYYFGLGFILDAPYVFFLLPVLHSISSFLFNVGYHISFAGAADSDSLGKEIGARYLVSSLVTLSAPFLGGVVIAIAGFNGVFLMSTVLLFVAVLPLFYFPQRPLSSEISLKSVWSSLANKYLVPFAISGAGYAMETMISGLVWPIFMFMVLGSAEEFGGVVSIGLLAGALITFFIGFLSDVGRRRRVILWSSVLHALVWLSRLFYNAPPAVALSQVAGNTVSSSLLVGWSSQYYRIARALPSPSSFILSREVLYHIVRVPFLAFMIPLAAYLPLDSFFAVSFVMAAVLSLSYIFANKVHTSVVAVSSA